MDKFQYRRNTTVLWGLILVAMAYSLWFYRLETLTGINTLDGILGVLLGLYICSRPAANAIDLLFFERRTFRRIASEWSSVRWLTLNILTLLMGWIVLVIGVTCLTGHSA